MSPSRGEHSILAKKGLIGNEEKSGGQGFEPRYAAPEAAVLPLDDPPLQKIQSPNIKLQTWKLIFNLGFGCLMFEFIQ